MNDTICAIATSSGVGAISIVRISGEDALNIVNKVFKGPNVLKAKSHSILYGHIYDNENVVDEVLLMVMRAPKTYTKEDTIEINCHGGSNCTYKVLELLLAKGARLAEPGEFTKRAYLNGRINLIEAEAVNDLIVAKTDAARTLAINNVDGLLTKKIKSLRNLIVKILANIEVNIDYPEYTDEVQVTNNMIEEYLNKIDKDLTNIVKGTKSGRIIKDGVNVAIVGKPNVGKSSILNHLLDEEKAIVTEIPGTTRDIVEGTISLNGVAINFIDTAGIRKTKDIVEKIGVDKSKKATNTSDIVLFVVNNNEKIDKEEKDLLKDIPKDKLIVMVNKSDLKKNADLSFLKGIEFVCGNTVEVNGLDALKEKIIEKLKLNEIVNKDMSYVSNIRQINLINKADKAVKSAYKAYQDSMPIDVIEIDLKEAWEILGELIGENYSEELVDNIFANFCLGK